MNHPSASASRSYNTRSRASQPLSSQNLNSLAETNVNKSLAVKNISRSNSSIQKPRILLQSSQPECELSQLIENLRLIVQENINDNMLTSAEFFGNKLITMSTSEGDLHCLAKVFALQKQHSRALNLLLSNEKKHIIKNFECLKLAAECALELGNYQESLDILDIDCQDDQYERPKSKALVALLKGRIYKKMSLFERSKHYFEEALIQDCLMYEAFAELKNSQMLTIEEEQVLLSKIPFDSAIRTNADFYRSLYSIDSTKSIKLKTEQRNTLEKLAVTFKLGENIDVMIAKAKLLFSEFKFKETTELTKRIMKIDPLNFKCLELEISVLFELNERTKLFQLSHSLINEYPDLYISWFAVGCYYLALGKYADSRRYFSKCTIIKSDYGFGWIGFGHSFAGDGEYDQAINAYSTAMKLMKGSHIPLLCIALQHMSTNQTKLAEDYLTLAGNMCNSDPFLENELGVIAFKSGNYKSAITKFKKALEMTGTAKTPWIASIWTNLAQSHLRLKEYSKAKDFYHQLLVLDHQNTSAYSGLAVICYLENDLDSSIMYFHKALGIEPNDPFNTELLNIVLQFSVQENQNNQKSLLDDIDLPFDFKDITNPIDEQDLFIPQSVISRHQSKDSFLLQNQSIMDIESSLMEVEDNPFESTFSDSNRGGLFRDLKNDSDMEFDMED